jgi:chaperonin GroEL
MEKSLQVFCCYAREDQPFLMTLKKHLLPLQREGLITVQADIDISPGEEWEQKIGYYLNTAQIILLLLSPDFMASDYCYSKEMKRAMERHGLGEAYVIPIILRPTHWSQTMLGKLQALPTNAEPLTSRHWDTPDEAFFDVVGGIEKAVKELISRSQIEVSSIQESEKSSLPKERMALVAKNIQQQILKDTKVGENVDTLLTLAQALVNEGMKQVSIGVDPVQMTSGIEIGAEAVISYIRHIAVPVETRKQIMQVASHAVADETIGNLITEVLDRIGRDGVITVEFSQSTNFETEYVEGMTIDLGLFFSDFMTNAEKMDTVFNNPYILVSGKKISLAQDILPLLAQMEREHLSNIVIIAEDVDGEALAILMEKEQRSLLNVMIVTAPDSGEYRREMLGDIAILTGGQVISQSLNKVTLADLGQARRIVAHKNEITIVEGRGEAEDIQARIRQIMGQRGEATNDYDRERLQMRLAKLSGGVACIKVGAGTDTERVSRKASVERAIAVAHAAIEGGLVPGDGVVLLNAVESLDQMHMHGDVATGVSVLRRALEEPLCRLALQEGRDSSKIIEGIRDAQRIHQNKSYGYNMLSDTYENLLEVGIVDAAVILCSELRKASHIAIAILRR